MGDGVSMEKIRNLSLKKTMVLYTILSLIVTFFLSVSIIEIAGQIQEEVWWKYVDQDEYYQAMNDRNENFEVVVPRPNQSKMSRMDWHISETCDFLQTYGVLLFSFAGCGIAVSLFYKNKLKRPIQELKMASQMIAEEDLDFHMAYENEDEMGMLCREFERMRGQLEENNRRLWQMIEDERVLRAAIAHDIRSPLAIMRGYQEMLLEFVPEDMLDQEKMMEMLRGGMLQIERMNHFIDSMRKMTKLEERELNCSVVDEQTHIQLLKLDKKSGQALGGAKFVVTDSKGKEVMKFVTKDEGYDITGKLVVGETYTFTETSAPSGYQLAEPVKITIKDTSKVQTVTVKDVPIPDVPDTPQTGGTLPVIPLAAGFFGVAAAALMVWKKRGVVKK